MTKNSKLVKASREDFRTNSRFNDITGTKFGFLTVNDVFGYRKYSDGRIVWVWNCKCDCGNTRQCATQELFDSTSYSCGCKQYLLRVPNQKYDPIEAAFRAKASNYKALAKLRKLHWGLSIEQTIFFLKGDCFYCGIPPINEYSLLRNRRNKNLILSSATEDKHKIILWNGIDRLDNAKGYALENCVSCCVHCNSAKMQRSVKEFYEWIERIVAHRRKR